MKYHVRNVPCIGRVKNYVPIIKKEKNMSEPIRVIYQCSVCKSEFECKPNHASGYDFFSPPNYEPINMCEKCARKTVEFIASLKSSAGKIPDSALEDAIQHWKNNFTAYRLTGDKSVLYIDAIDCPLCRKYASSSSNAICEQCPVRKRTGRARCERTPFEEISLIVRYDNTKTEQSRLLSLINDEITFLESLR
jgi:hypothetical protein